MQLIQNQWQTGLGPEFVSTNPVTEEILWKGHEADHTQVDTALLAAHKALPNWSGLDFLTRVSFVKKLQTLLAQNKNNLATTISQEVGKPFWESLTEVDAMINKVDISIEAFLERCAPRTKNTPTATSVTRFKPQGVVAVFGPFNFPGHLAHGHIVPALLAGNTVLFKPSPLTPKVAEDIAALWLKAGLPVGVFQLLQGQTLTGQALAEHPLLNGLFFTGSTQTGLHLNRLFSAHPQKILALEMGGNNPLVVHDVKNIEAAVYHTVLSAYLTSGQRCTCARRLIVPKSQSGDAFIKALSEAIQKIRIGTPFESSPPFMGPVIHAQSASHMIKTQTLWLSKGATACILAKPLSLGASFVSPGLIDVTNASPLEDEETFGPLLQLIRPNDFNEALQIANNTRFGLAAGLLSDNFDLYETFQKSIRAGVINWNQPLTGALSSAPFGGVGLSGNHHPSAYFATDYCAYPVASLETQTLVLPQSRLPGFEL